MDYDFKNEDDVKEYLDKLGIEYRFGCFSEKKPNECHLLGDYLETVKSDYEKAGRIYRNNCKDFQYGKSCSKYGNYVYLGKGVKQNSSDALSYYEKGCSAGETKACTSAGLMLFTDPNKSKLKDVENRLQKGRDFLDTACGRDDDYACYYLSGVYIQGREDAIHKDMKEAFKYSQKSCELGNLFACVNLSQMYKKGDGVDKDIKLGAFYEAKAKSLQKEHSEVINLQRQ